MFQLNKSGPGNRQESYNQIGTKTRILQLDNESLSSWLPSSENLVAFICIPSFLSTKSVARINDIN